MLSFALMNAPIRITFITIVVDGRRLKSFILPVCVRASFMSVGAHEYHVRIDIGFQNEKKILHIEIFEEIFLKHPF
jgi:hypothetical protein